MCAGIIGKIGGMVISTTQVISDISVKVKKNAFNILTSNSSKMDNHYWKEHYPNSADASKNDKDFSPDIALLFEEGTTTQQIYLTNDTLLIEVINGDKKIYVTLEQKNKEFIETKQWKDGEDNKITLQCDGEKYDIPLSATSDNITLENISRQTRYVSRHLEKLSSETEDRFEDVSEMLPSIEEDSDDIFEESSSTFHDDIDELDRRTGIHSLALIPEQEGDTMQTSLAFKSKFAKFSYDHMNNNIVKMTRNSLKKISSHLPQFIGLQAGLSLMQNIPVASANPIPHIVSNAPSLMNTIMASRIPLFPVVSGLVIMGGGMVINQWLKPKHIPIKFSSSAPQSFSAQEWLDIHPEFISQKANIKIAPIISLLFEDETKINDIDITNTIKLLEIKNDDIYVQKDKEKKAYIIFEKRDIGNKTTHYNLSVEKEPIEYFLDETLPPVHSRTESFSIRIRDESYQITVAENSSFQEIAKSVQRAFFEGRTNDKNSSHFQEFSFSHTPEGYVSKLPKLLLHTLSHPITSAQAVQTKAQTMVSPAIATAQSLASTMKNVHSYIADYCTSSTEHVLEKKDNLVFVEKNNHFVIKNKENNTQEDIHLTDAKDIKGHYKDITFKLNNKNYGCKLYTKKLNVKDLKNIINQAIEHFIKGKFLLSDSKTPPYILPEIRDDAYSIPTQYDVKNGTETLKLIKDDDIYSLFSPTNVYLGDIRIDTTQKKDPFLKNNLGKYHSIDFKHNTKNYNITLYKDTLETSDIISALQQALKEEKNIILNKHLKPFQTHIDWKERYPPNKNRHWSDDFKLLYSDKTLTQEIPLNSVTDLVEINHNGKKSFLTIYKDPKTHSDILCNISLKKEEKTLMEENEVKIQFKYDGILYSKTLFPHITSLQDIDIHDPDIKKLFTPDITPLTTTSSPLKEVYKLFKNKDDYSVINTENYTRTPVILSNKRKDIKGDYTQIDFDISTRRYTKKIYSKNPPKQKDIGDALDETLTHLEKNPTTTSHALDDARDSAYPPVTSQIFEVDSKKMQLVKDGDTYSLFCEDGKTCLTKDDFKIQNTNDPFVGYGLGTHHALEFTINDKPHKIDMYKDTLDDNDVLEAVKKAINTKSDVILDAQLNPFEKADYWEKAYPILSKPSVPKEISRLLDKDILTRTSRLSSTTQLIELNHKGEKSFLTFQKQPSGEGKFTLVKAWEKEDDVKTKMLSFEYDTQKYDTPLPVAFKSLQEIDITLPTLRDIFKPTTEISTQELISTHPTVKQKSSEPQITNFIPSFTSSYHTSHTKKPIGKRKKLGNAMRKTYSFASSITAKMPSFFGNLFGGFLGFLGSISPYIPNTQGGFMTSQQPTPNYFMPRPQTNMQQNFLMPQHFIPDNFMNMMPSENAPLIRPNMTFPKIEVYKPHYANSSLPQKSGKFPYENGGKLPKMGKFGGKIPKAEPFLKSKEHHHYKKDSTQNEYDPQFHQNFQPTFKQPYPMNPHIMTPQDIAYMEQFWDDPNKSP